MINYTAISPADYLKLRYALVKYFEESNSYSLLPYFDSAQPPLATIGLGFNIETNVVNAVLDKFGVTDATFRQRIRNAISTASGNADLRSSLDAIMAQHAAQFGGRSRFAFASEAEIISVFGTIAPNYEAVLDNRIPAVPEDTVERAVLFSMAYNQPNLIGPGMQAAISAGDRAELFFEIRYNSNGGSTASNGIAKRRFIESEILGLFDPGPVANADALLAFRMFTRHEKKILAYDQTYAKGRTYANNDIGLIEQSSGMSFGSIQTIRDELAAARAKLIQSYGGGRDFDNVWVASPTDFGEVEAKTVDRRSAGNSNDLIFGGIDNSGNDAATDDSLYGGGGNDTIHGGLGSDHLYGGDGEDVLWSTRPTLQENDQKVDTLAGGAGKDIYHIDSTDDVVVDTDAIPEEVWLNGQLFKGGKSTKANPDVYFDRDGTRYTYAQAPGGGGPGLLASMASAANYALQITSPDGITVYITDFINGEASIWLRKEDEEDEEDGLDPESYLSPLVLDLDGDGIELTGLGDVRSFFDFAGDGFREMTAWVAPDDGLLSFDRNGNGKIDDSSELFGANPTDLAEMVDQPGGMFRLSQLDSNRDGIISSADADFASLTVWRDLNSNGATDAGELVSLADAGIASIDLDYFRVREAIGDSVLTERSSFTRTDGSSGEIGDVWFKTRPTIALAVDEVTVDDDIRDLPYIGGSGLVRDLHSAMQLDPLLEEMVRDLDTLAPGELWQLSQKVEAILLRWTGADQVQANSRGNWVDARYLTALEKWTGDAFVQQAWMDSNNPYPQASAALVRNYRELVAEIAVKLVAQIDAGATLLPELGYFMDAFLVLDPAFSAIDFAERAAANAPSDAYQQIVYWHGIVMAADGLSDGTTFDQEQLADAIDTVLAAANPMLSYDGLRRLILGTDGNDRLVGTSTELNEDFGNTDPQNWTLPDLGGVDWIMGGGGDDRMTGGYGRDLYLFGRGFGHDTVYDNFGGQYDGTGDQDDVLQLIGDLTLADIEIELLNIGGRPVSRIHLLGSDDYIQFELTNRLSADAVRRDQLRVIDSTGASADIDLRTGQLVTIDAVGSIEELVFERLRDTFALLVKGPNGALLAVIPDYFSSTREEAIGFSLNGAAVTLQDIDNERLRRAQTDGNDRITDTPRSNSITGLAGNDWIEAGKGDDVIDGGAGADMLRGDRGADTYLFGRGSGVDTIVDRFGHNVVEFGANIALTDLQLSYGPNGTDLVIRIAGTQDQLVVSGAFGNRDGGVETFRFADQSTLTRDEVQALLPPAGGTGTGLLNQGTDGVDTIGSIGGLTVAAGLGGRDTYRFNRGDGVMVIGDTDLDDWNWDSDGPFPNGDIIHFGAGITAADLELRLVPNDFEGYSFSRENSIEIRIKGTEDVIRVHCFSPYWYYYGAGDDPSHRTTAIDELRFADGSIMDLDAIFTALQLGTDGDDRIRPWFDNAIIDGGAGNDLLSPGDGGSIFNNATFRFGRESGHDEFEYQFGRLTSYNHRILFDEGISVSDIRVTVRNDGFNDGWAGFYITIPGSDASLHIPIVSAGSYFEFADGTTLDSWQMGQLAVDQAMSSSGDNIRLFSWTNSFQPNLVQAQTIALAAGMGERIVERGSAIKVDIRLPDGLALADLDLSLVLRDGKAYVRAGFGSGGDAILLPDATNFWMLGNPPAPDYMFDVRFLDSTGAVLTNSGFVNAQLYNPGALGDASNNLLIGTSADDVFSGEGGTDTILFGANSGHDSIFSVIPLNQYSSPQVAYRVRLEEGTSLDQLTYSIAYSEYSSWAKIGIEGSDATLGMYGYSQILEFEDSSGTVWDQEQFARHVAARANDPLGTMVRLPWPNLAPGETITVEAGGGDDDVVLGNGMEFIFRRGDGHDSVEAQRIVLADVYSLDEIDVTFTEVVNTQYFDDEVGGPILEEGNVDVFYTITIRDTGDSITFPEYAWPVLVLADGSLPYPSFGDLAAARLSTNGDDVIVAPTWSWTWFDGKGGNDILNGYLGESKYFFGHGDGTDTVIENGWYYDYDWDTIEFKEGVTPDQVTVDLDAEGNLIVAITGSDDKIIVPSLKQRIFEPGIEEILFFDGTSWLVDDLLAQLMVATSGDDVIFDRYGDGETPDRWTFNHSDLMDGGAGNDFLAGGAGNDFYVFGLGYGEDTILDKSPVGLSFEVYHIEDWWDSYPELETDTLTFLPGIEPEDLEFLRGGVTGNDLIIRIRGTSDQITVVDQFRPLSIDGEKIIGDYDYEWIEEDSNGNGRIDPEEISYVPLRYLATTPNGIEAFRFSSQQVLTATDIVGLVEGVDNSGDNDYLTDNDGGTLDGGAGNDVLSGGTGSDDFVFERGYGEDVIRDMGGYDIINFGIGIRQSYLHFSRVGDSLEDLLIEVDGPERLTLTVDGQFAQVPGVVEEFSFLTGESLTWIDVQNIILEQARTSGGDDILGFLTDDVVDGGDGNDVLKGWKGDDLVIGGDGRDVAVFSGAQTDYLVEEVDGAVRVTDLRAGMDGIDLLYGVEELLFEGGTGGNVTSVDLVDPNRAPFATDVAASMTEDSQIIVSRSLILAAASDPDGDLLSIAGVGGFEGGRAWINIAGDLVFEATTDHFGTGGFDVRMSDGRGGETVARVIIAIAGTQDAPRLAGVAANGSFDEDSPLDIAIPEGLFVDPDGDELQLSATAADGGPLPSWLAFSDGRLTGTPPSDFNGQLVVRVTASDGQAEASTEFLLTINPVNDTPFVANQLADIVIGSGDIVDYLLPPDLFGDVDGDDLQFAIQQADGSPLPSWLSFTAGRLFGTAPADLEGELVLQLYASDGEALTSQLFSIISSQSNHPPHAQNPLGTLQSAEDQPFSFTLPSGLFSDPDGDAMSLTLTLADGSPLPSWVAFDGSTISGQPPADFNGATSLRLVASDGQYTAAQTFELVIAPVNDAPTLSQPIADVQGNEDAPIDFAIPVSTFVDVDNGQLTLSARMAGNGAPLPSWLNFANGRFTGTPPANFNGFIDIEVSASDGQSTAQDIFRLTIDPANDAPLLSQPLADVQGNEDVAVDFTLPASTFTDVDNPELALSARLADGAALPAWLSFNAGRFTGTPPANFNGFIDIEVTATDGQASAQDQFRLTINPVNDPPINVTPMADVTMTEGQAISIAIPGNAFTDPDGQVLSYTAALASGAALPSWLTFQNGIFSGTAPSTAAGVYEIRVTASDGQSSASDIFLLTIADANRAPLANADGVFVTVRAEALLIMAADLLANDSDPDGDPLSIVSVSGAAYGTVALNAQGNIIYTPDGGYMGNDSFTYVLSDGTAQSSAQVSVKIDDPFATWTLGTEGVDSFFGNMQGVNRLYALGDHDHVKGGQLDDWLAGGLGNDKMEGLGGDDRLWGMGGNDQLIGNNGYDTAYYFGLMSTYTISTSNGTVSITDNQALVDGNDGTDTLNSIELLSFKGGQTMSIASPIILDLDGNGVQTVSASQSKALFDMDGDGLADDTSWIGSGDGFLFLDRDGNGTLSGIGEMSFLGDVPGAASDLAGLRAFDSNGDGALASSDERFADFRIWRDADGDGAVDQGEVLTLAAAGFKSLDLTGTLVTGTVNPGDVAVIATGSWTRTNGTTMQFADAALTYFSTARQPLAGLAGAASKFGKKPDAFRIVAAGGAIRLHRRESSSEVDPRTGEIGLLAQFAFKGKTLGMLSPVVLDLDGKGIDFIKSKKSDARFDMNGDGRLDRAGWIGKGDGFLVIDRNLDGRIASNSELTFGSEDPDASSSLEALAKLDSNRDGRLDALDARFGELRVWKDANANGVTDSGELLTLAQAGIKSVGLSALAATESEGKVSDNLVRSTAVFTRTDGSTGTVGDVALGFRSGGRGLSAGVLLDAFRSEQLFGAEPLGRDWESLIAGIGDQLPWPGRSGIGPGLALGLPGTAADLRVALMAQDLAAFGAGRADGLDDRRWQDHRPLDIFAA